jgi:hypothetical protein
MSVKDELTVIGAAHEAKRIADLIANKMGAPWAMESPTFLVGSFDRLSVIAFEGARAAEAIAREQDNAPEVEL